MCSISMARTMIVIAAVLLAAVLLRASSTTRPGPGAPPPAAQVTSWTIGAYPECRERAYAPVGTLSNDDGRVLQLYAMPSASHRDRWHYQTMAEDDRIPLELTLNGRRCGQKLGCDRVYTGDRMSATELGTSQPLRVQLYDE